MSGQQNWRTEVNAPDYFGHQKKQAAVENRRPVIRKPSDLVGPGIAATAVAITDFNDTLATFNGFFSAVTGTTNAPTSGEDYVGVVTSDSELGGAQTFYGLTSGDTYRRVFTRNPSDPTTLYWGAWTIFGSGGGGGSLTVQDENVNVATGVTQIDFQGAGITAATGTGEVVVTVPGETLPVTIIDAEGDLIVGSANDTAIRKAVGADGTVLVADAASTGGVKWSTRPRTATFKYAGVLAIGTGATRLYNDTGATWTVLSIRASVETAPSGSSVVIDVNKNGTTLFTTQANRPTITSTNTTSGKVTSMDVTTVADGDYLTIDVDAIGSPAANLTVILVLAS